MANPISIPQNFSTTLNVVGGIDDSQTTGIVLTVVTGLPTDGGILAFTWANPLDSATVEYIEYTGISGNTLTGVTRGAEGVSAKAHSNGCTIVGVVSQAHIKRVRDKLTGNDVVLVQDPNGNEIIKTSYVASAVNEATITNAATGNAPVIAATGGDTNIDLNLAGKGTGSAYVQSDLWFNVNKGGTDQENVANDTLVTWSGKTDPNGNFDLTTEQWTCPKSGRWLVTIDMGIIGTVDNKRYGFALQLDAVDYLESINPAGSEVGHTVSLARIIYISADDVFRVLFSSSDSGNTADIQGSALRTNWSMHYLSSD